MRSRIWKFLALLTLVTQPALFAAAPVCTNTKTELVSINSSGTTVANGDSSQQDISEEGRYVAFRSHATDVVAFPVNQQLGINIYLRDRLNGTVQVLDDRPIGQGFNDAPQDFVVSGDGHAIAFETLAGNVTAVPDTNGHTDIYIKDFRTNSFLRATVPDSSITTTTQSQHHAGNFSTNRDARYVGFVSSGLVFSPEYYAFPEPTNVFNFHIYVRDTLANRTYLVTRGVNAQGQPAPLNGTVGRPVLAANGQLLAFTTDSTNLRNFPSAGGRRDVYIAAFNGTTWDVIEKIVTQSDSIDYVNRNDISISPDGRYVAYIASEQSGLAGELYVYDRQSATTFRPRPGGTRPQFAFASRPKLGYETIAWQDYDLTGEGFGGAFWIHFSAPTVLQRIGRETNGAPACCGSNGNGGQPGGIALSADGRWATYHSASPRIVPPDGNGTYDVFVQRMTPAADFTFVCTSLTCSFDAAPTQSACPLQVYKWSFGDSGVATGTPNVHTYASAGQYPVTLTVTDVNGATSAITKLVTPAAGSPGAATSYVALTPCRIWDSRNPGNGRIPSGQELILSISNPPQGCAPNPNARAASINVAIVTPDAQGYLSAYAAGSPSVTSALNFAPATSPRANNMIVPVAANGTIALKPMLASGSTDIVVDINGYFTDSPGVGVTPLGFQSLTPCRVYDSRLNGGAPYTQGEIRSLTVRGVCGIPSGAAAASLNAAVVGATTDGHLTLFPAGPSVPLASTLNYKAAPTGATANGARVALAAGSPDLGTLMAVYGGAAHLVLDANGYFKNGAPLQYTAVTPCRALDSRLAAQGPALQANETRALQIRGNCGIPSDAQAAMVNVTVVGPTSNGYVLAYPSGTTRPLASTINFPAGEPAEANGTIVPLSQTLPNDLSIFALLSGGATTHVVIDVFGYFR
jgi:PKD repeat protein